MIDEPAGPQRHAGLDVDLLVVGAATGDGPRHGQEAIAGELARSLQINGAGDATHGESSVMRASAGRDRIEEPDTGQARYQSGRGMVKGCGAGPASARRREAAR